MVAVPISVPEGLSAATLAAFEEAMAGGLQVPGARVLVLRGSPACFCRGMSLASAGDAAGEDLGDEASAALFAFAELLVRLRFCALPTVAVVEGPALGGGLGLAAACDIVVATEGARLGLPEVLMGMAPATLFPVLLERCTPQVIRRLALVGASISAEQAAAVGLVDEVTAEDTLERCLHRWVRGLSRGAPPALAQLKALSGFESEEGLRAMTRGGALRSLELLKQGSAQRAQQAYLAGDVPWSLP